MDVERTALPGIGLRHLFTTERNRTIGVISHRNGQQDLIIYDRDDPDRAELIPLSADEAGTLAELLGAPHVVERLTDLHRQVEGLVSVQIPIMPGSRYDGFELGQTQIRRRTGASIVAVVREGEVLVSPRPDFPFRGGDTVVAVGTEDGTAAAAALLCDG